MVAIKSIKVMLMRYSEMTEAYRFFMFSDINVTMTAAKMMDVTNIEFSPLWKTGIDPV